MSTPKAPPEPTTADLQRLLEERRHAAAAQRLSRLRGDSRMVELPGTAIPDPVDWTAVVEQTEAYYGRRAARRRLLDRTLFAVELLALLGLVLVAARLWQTNRQLNADLTALQQAQVAQIDEAQARARAAATAASLPPTVVAAPAAGSESPRVSLTPVAPASAVGQASTDETAPVAINALDVTAAPVSGAVVLPGGHEPPAPGQTPQPGEAGEVPPSLLPAFLAYDPLPTPQPGPELAVRIRIPAIGVDHPVVQGDDWEQLKLGVGQHSGSAFPGQTGNVVLSAHNDIYGEIFRHLDRLAPGNEIILSTATQDFTYLVEEVRVVDPTEVWVMAPTAGPQVTLISCFPYRINTHRIAVLGRLVEPSS